MEISTINKFHAKEEKCLKTLIVNWILAWSLLCDCCAKLLEYIKDIILSDHFITLHKQKPSDFTRQRKLPFQTLIFFMMNLISGSYQKELNNFFQRLMGLDVPKRFVSKVALSKARLKLKYEAFVDLKNADEFMKVFNGGYFVEWECGADLSADTIDAKMKIAEKQCEKG